MATQYTEEFKKDAVRYWKEHSELGITKCAKNLGVSKGALSTWGKAYDEHEGDILSMKYFRLADTAYRKQVDLRLYEDDIATAVAKVKPNAQLFVEQDGFYTIPELGKRESIAVSQELRRNSGLDEYTMQHPCLFNSIPHIPINKQEDK